MDNAWLHSMKYERMHIIQTMLNIIWYLCKESEVMSQGFRYYIVWTHANIVYASGITESAMVTIAILYVLYSDI